MAISPKLLNDGESVVVDTRTHPKAILWPLVCLVLLLAAAVFLQVWADQGAVTVGGWVLAVAAIIWLVVRPVVLWLTSTYTITNRRLITRSGFIVRRGHDIPLARISDVAYEHGLIDRAFGCGTLIISDASTHGRVMLRDIPRVEETQRTLNELLHRLHDPTPRDEGA